MVLWQLWFWNYNLVKNMDEKERMVDLAKKLDQKHETYIEQKTDSLDESVMKKYKDRFGKMLLQREASYMPSSEPIRGVGRTVNSITDNQFEPVTNKSFQNTINNINGFTKQPQLTAKEAFEVAVKRTLDSGDPINGIGFYDEVNWSLQNMGFSAKSGLDIKNAINDMLKYGEIKSS